MNRTVIRIITALSLSLATAFPAAAKDNCQIAHEIDSIIQNQLPAGSDISVSIWDLGGDSAVYSYRADVLCRPASTMKLLTSYTALKTLGADYCFETRLCTDGTVDSDSTLNGNLYLVGGLDPQLMEKELHVLVKSLRKVGISRINGNIIADISIMDDVYWGSGWSWDDTPNSFQPYISPLMIHGGFIGISVKPGQKGCPPIVNTYPQSDYLHIENNALTGVASAGPLSIDRDWLHNDNTIVISGNAAKASSRDLNLFNCSDFTFALFREYLQKDNITFCDFGWGVCPGQTTILASTGHTLTAVLKETLKESVNLNAEAMLLQAAHTAKGRPIGFTKAAEYMADFLKKHINPGGKPFNVVDGSGLSVYDYVPASLFTDLLRQIYKEPEIYSIIYSSMPIAGYDGTLKGRLGTSTTANRIHAKTGTVTGSCTLAGYARTSDGRDIAFCIMNEGAIKMAPSRRVQDAICTVLCE